MITGALKSQIDRVWDAGGTHAATVLTLAAITGGSFDEAATKPGLFAVDPGADKRVRSSDFLMCRGNGNRELVGVGVYTRFDRQDLVFPDTVIAGRIDSNQVVMAFLAVAWKQSQVRRQIEAIARTTNGTFKVNQQTLSDVTLSVPARGLQEEFAAIVEGVRERRDVVGETMVGLDQLFAALQSRAFRGEL